MAAFELNTKEHNEKHEHSRFHEGNDCNNVLGQNLNPHRLREECIIALKVYDSCRHLHINMILQSL
jgi:hypothetical protein